VEKNHILHNVNTQVFFAMECKRLPVSNLCRKLESDQCRQVPASLVREPRFVLFRWWTGSAALCGLKVDVLNKMLWPFTTSAHTRRCRPFLANQKQFLSSDATDVIHSPACFAMKTTSLAAPLTSN